MPEKFTIIGGAGFIGTRLCRILSAGGKDFEILDLKPSRSFPRHSRIADIRDIDALRKEITGDRIVHLAAVHRDDVSDLSLYSATNIQGTQNICQVAREKAIRRIIFTSSVAVYGFAPAGTDETGDINPINEYGRTKWEGEKVLESWFRENEPHNNLIIVRPTVVFGEGNRGNVYNLLKQIASGRFMMVGSGTNRKSMAYVENIATFLYRAAISSASHKIINYVDAPDFDMNGLVSEVRQVLTGKKGVGVRLPYELGLVLGFAADLVAKGTGRTLPVSTIRVRKFCANTSFRSAKHELDGFIAPVPIEEGLRRTLKAEFLSPDPSREIFYTE